MPCVRCLASRFERETTPAMPAQPERLRPVVRAAAGAAEADRAMAWLARAFAAGYDDRAHMEKDADLDVFRDRDDFRKLVAGERGGAK